jgi:hypothetical protein
VPVAGEGSASLEVAIDGRLILVDLSRLDTRYGQEVRLVSGLTEGQHEACLTVANSDQGHSRVGIDALIVRRSPFFLIRRGLSLLALASLAVFVLFVAWRHWNRRDPPC